MAGNSVRERLIRRTRNIETYSVLIFSQDLASADEFQIKLKDLINYIVISKTHFKFERWR
jgi:hypothetical protein